MEKHQLQSACISAQEYYYDWLSPDLREEIPAETQEHLRHCRQCRGNMAQLRKILASQQDEAADSRPQNSDWSALLETHFSCLDRPMDCAAVKPFLPSLADPAGKVTIPTPVTVHLEHCPDCLHDFQTLQNLPLTRDQRHDLSRLFAGTSRPGNFRKTEKQIAALAGRDHSRTLQAILQRPNSGITTCFSLRSASPQAGNPANSQEAYSLQVLRHRPDTVRSTAANTPQPAAGSRKKDAVLHLLRSRKFQTAAAAVFLLFGMMFLFRPSAARAVPLHQIYQAVQDVQNLHITRTSPASRTPLEEIWISKESELLVIKNQAGSVLWDLSRNTRKIKASGTDGMQTQLLEEGQVNNQRKYMERFFDLMPFDDVSSLPDNASWNQVPLENPADTVPGTTLYELTWHQQPGDVDTIRYFKWRCYLDLKTNLPQKTELYISSDPENGYELINTTTAQSISKETFGQALQSLGF